MSDDRTILSRHLEYMDGLERGQCRTGVGNALKAMADARDAERAAIVAWLRDEEDHANAGLRPIKAMHYRIVADAIERGAHHEREG